LDEEYAVGEEAVARLRADGFVKLGGVLSPQTIAAYEPEITRTLFEQNTQTLPLEQRSTYQKAFLQVTNMWPHNEAVRRFVHCTRLAKIAADLLEVRSVRLFADQGLYKEAGGGITPWHADQYYFPVSNDNVVTAWVPLQDTPLEMGPLAFCEKSHRFQHGRDLEIGDESEITLKEALQGFSRNNTPFELGDVSFHAGWTFHRAEANTSTKPREVMTVIYIDEEMRLAEPKNKNQVIDMQELCPGVTIGEIIDSHLTPIIYSRD